MPSMSALVGEGHQRIVRDLRTHLDDLMSGATNVSIVVLRGGSGVGKSRLVQELYGLLAAEQTEPRYWPELRPDLRAPGDNLNPLAQRKIIGPETTHFSWSPEAEPSFGWWTVSCQRLLSEMPASTVANLERQLEMHLVPLGLAWSTRAGLVEQAKRSVTQQWRMRVVDALREGSLETATTLLAQLGVTIPGLGLAVGYLEAFLAAIRQRRTERKLLVTETELEATSRSVEVGSMLRHFARPDLPMVLAVEDMHLMGDDLAQLVLSLADLEHRSPILVLGTAWAEQRADSPFTTLMTHLANTDAVRVIDVPLLPSSASSEIVREHAPTSDERVIQALANRWRNPYALKLALSDRRITSRTYDGAIHLMPEDLERVPATIRGLYYDRWKELPQEVRAVLTFAAAGGIERAADGNRLVLPAVIPAVMTDDSLGAELFPGHPEQASLSAAISDAHDPHGWLTRESSHLSTFLEPDAALSALSDLSQHEIDQIRHQTMTYVQQRLFQRWGRAPEFSAHRHEGEDQALAYFYLALHGNTVPTSDPHWLLAAWTVTDVRFGSGEYKEAADACALIVDYHTRRGRDDYDLTIRASSVLGRLLLLAGDLPRSASVYREVTRGCLLTGKPLTSGLGLGHLQWAILRDSTDPDEALIALRRHAHDQGLGVVVKVRAHGEQSWIELSEDSVTKVPIPTKDSDLDIQLGVRNNSEQTLTDITARAFLGPGLDYIASSSTVKNAQHPQGDGHRLTSNAIATWRGENLGNYGSGANAFLRFGAARSQHTDDGVYSIGAEVAGFLPPTDDSQGSGNPAKITFTWGRFRTEPQAEQPDGAPSPRWGRWAYWPSRPTYQLPKAGLWARQPLFNSVTNNPNYGDERAFLLVKPTGLVRPGGWRQLLDIVPGHSYLLRIHIDNCADDEHSPPAENTRVIVNLPTTPAMAMHISAFVTADNAEPPRISATNMLSGRQPFVISYEAGSARYYSNLYPANGVPLGDDIVTTRGALVGSTELDGRIPPGYRYAGIATVRFTARAYR